jgi:hypothetical protein
MCKLAHAFVAATFRMTINACTDEIDSTLLAKAACNPALRL